VGWVHRTTRIGGRAPERNAGPVASSWCCQYNSYIRHKILVFPASLCCNGSMSANPDLLGKPRTAVFTPLYKQIKQLLVTSLEQGEWKPGELIPS
jgi:hypothetical protein